MPRSPFSLAVKPLQRPGLVAGRQQDRLPLGTTQLQGRDLRHGRRRQQRDEPHHQLRRRRRLRPAWSPGPNLSSKERTRCTPGYGWAPLARAVASLGRRSLSPHRFPLRPPEDRRAGRRAVLSPSFAIRLQSAVRQSVGRRDIALGCARGPVAQRLEQRTHNPSVPGSNPGRPIGGSRSAKGLAVVYVVSDLPLRVPGSTPGLTPRPGSVSRPDLRAALILLCAVPSATRK